MISSKSLFTILYLIYCLQSLGNASLIDYFYNKQQLTKAKCTQCPDGWNLNSGKCYKTFNMLVNYSNALKVCKEENALLAMPKTIGDLNFIYKQLTNNMDLFQNATGYIWIGASSFSGNPVEFTWADKSKIEYDNPLWCIDFPHPVEDWVCVEIATDLGPCIRNFNCDTFGPKIKPIKNMLTCEKSC